MCSPWMSGWQVGVRWHSLGCGAVIFFVHPAMPSVLSNLEESRIRKVASAGMGRRDVRALWFCEGDEGWLDVLR